MLASKEEEIDKLKGRKNIGQTTIDESVIDASTPKKGSISLYHDSAEKQAINGGQTPEHLNKDYVKNVFFKYLEYQANGNEKEALTLEKVLFTVLKATEKDVEVIEKARVKNLGGGILSYFYS